MDKRVNQKSLNLAASPKRERKAPQFRFPAPTGADRAVRSFMRECLMPILADEFFRRRDAELKTETKVIQQKRTTEPLCMEVEP